MKVLFTGSSSFTGYWIIQEMIRSGYDVTATFQHPEEYYKETKKERVDSLKTLCRTVFSCSFGSESFLEVISSQSFDVLAHHAAEVNHYKSMTFDFVKALENNSHNISQVMDVLAKSGCKRILLTGTVFEPNEGKGGGDLCAIYPYGLSKGLTYQAFSYYCGLYPIHLSKFVIPSPFGPLEKEGLTSYLLETWLEGNVATVKYPEYIRDHIPVTLLAKAYVYCMEQELRKLAPKGYSESVGRFTARLAKQLKQRSGHACEFVLNQQREFSEPKMRLNGDHPAVHWNEKLFWDEYINHYVNK